MARRTYGQSERRLRDVTSAQILLPNSQNVCQHQPLTTLTGVLISSGVSSIVID